MGSNVLIIGGGGREHALAWKLVQSPRIGKLYVAPGNGGTRTIAENMPYDPNDLEGLVHLAEARKVDLTVVGPEEPLAYGIVDHFRRHRRRIFGPTSSAAIIESSKTRAKGLMQVAGIPTAGFRIFREHAEACAHVRERAMPCVIKASGLASGKGVIICRTVIDAEAALDELMLTNRLDGAGHSVVIEDLLEGPEVSVHALSDGKASVLFPPSQDHKTVGEGDTGKNTGGMGSIVPAPHLDAEAMRQVDATIVRPMLERLAAKNAPFTGLLFPGLILTTEGPKVLEYNVRFGDPETQGYMRLLKTDLLDVLDACVDGTLADLTLEWHPGFAACVVLASGGYPEAYVKGFEIQGVADAEAMPGVVVFHAGTTFTDKLVTSGGRVLGVTATGETLAEALDRAYAAVRVISFDGMHHRRDIGAKAMRLLP